jgi:hypothetical protein
VITAVGICYFTIAIQYVLWIRDSLLKVFYNFADNRSESMIIVYDMVVSSSLLLWLDYNYKKESFEFTARNELRTLLILASLFSIAVYL